MTLGSAMTGGIVRVGRMIAAARRHRLRLMNR
ncbi:hypothetical protein L485_17290 [Sphingobium baderi LL03]|uniref:Uncharacterized protein n=1 Tax=Sphingobium baderi LL03 TaxID=1114964 RepID=T0GCN9_9SPHN|nr:hypothetical protein L485_17290 [Sphingobium baderi LL03]